MIRQPLFFAVCLPSPPECLPVSSALPLSPPCSPSGSGSAHSSAQGRLAREARGVLSVGFPSELDVRPCAELLPRSGPGTTVRPGGAPGETRVPPQRRGTPYYPRASFRLPAACLPFPPKHLPSSLPQSRFARHTPRTAAALPARPRRVVWPARCGSVLLGRCSRRNLGCVVEPVSRFGSGPGTAARPVRCAPEEARVSGCKEGCRPKQQGTREATIPIRGPWGYRRVSRANGA